LAQAIAVDDGRVKMHLKPDVLILFAVYHGEKHIAEQLDSLLIQEKINIFILMSLDESTNY